MKTEILTIGLTIGSPCRSPRRMDSSRKVASRWLGSRPKSLLAALSLTILSMTPGGIAAQARTRYPAAKDPCVNDFARILTGEDAAEIRAALVRLKTETDVEAVVVTISSIRSYASGDTTIESFVTNLFNTWGIGDRL